MLYLKLLDIQHFQPYVPEMFCIQIMVSFLWRRLSMVSFLWRLSEVQGTAERYYANKLKEERFQLRKSSAANLEMMTPEMQQKEEELFLKKLDDEWRFKGISF